MHINSWHTETTEHKLNLQRTGCRSHIIIKTHNRIIHVPINNHLHANNINLYMQLLHYTTRLRDNYPSLIARANQEKPHYWWKPVSYQCTTVVDPGGGGGPPTPLKKRKGKKREKGG